MTYQERFVAIKHEPSEMFIAFSDELGPFGVEIIQMAAVLPESIAREFLGHEDGFHDDWILDIGDVNTKDFSLYEVDVILKSKI